LQSDESGEFHVVGFIDNAHTAFPKFLRDAIVKACCPDHNDLLQQKSGRSKNGYDASMGLIG
jgi:hypothetical protein